MDWVHEGDPWIKSIRVIQLDWVHKANSWISS